MSGVLSGGRNGAPGHRGYMRLLNPWASASGGGAAAAHQYGTAVATTTRRGTPSGIPGTGARGTSRLCAGRRERWALPTRALTVAAVT